MPLGKGYQAVSSKGAKSSSKTGAKRSIMPIKKKKFNQSAFTKAKKSVFGM